MADSVRAGDRYYLGSELGSLLHSSPSHVTEAGDADLLTSDVLAGLVEKMLGEIEGSETGSLRTEDRASPSRALSGEDSGVILTGELLIHSVKEADLTSADTYVTGRDVLVRTDAAPELKHKCLAETHNLSV